MAAKDLQDTCVLPSGGILYGEDSPWHSGEVVYRMMSVADERYMAGARKDSDSLVSEILQRCLVSPAASKADVRDLLVADRAFLLVRLRQLSYGDAYGFSAGCPACQAIDRYEVNLANLDVEELAEGFIEPIKVELPLAKRWVELALPRGRDEEEVARQTKAFRKRFGKDGGDPSYTIRMASYIRTIDGQPADFIERKSLVEGLYGRDSLAIRQAVEDVKLGLQTEVQLECPSCGHEFKIGMPMTDEFFRPRAS